MPVMRWDYFSNFETAHIIQSREHVKEWKNLGCQKVAVPVLWILGMKLVTCDLVSGSYWTKGWKKLGVQQCWGGQSGLLGEFENFIVSARRSLKYEICRSVRGKRAPWVRHQANNIPGFSIRYSSEYLVKHNEGCDIANIHQIYFTAYLCLFQFCLAVHETNLQYLTHSI